MNRFHFKLSSKLIGDHIHTQVFSGNEGQTLANTGTLIQRISEWGLFGATLKMGSTANYAIAQHILVTFEGDAEIVKELEEKKKQVEESSASGHSSVSKRKRKKKSDLSA